MRLCPPPAPLTQVHHLPFIEWHRPAEGTRRSRFFYIAFNNHSIGHSLILYVVQDENSLVQLDRASVPSRITVDISDSTQWWVTELTCTCFLCKFWMAYLYTYYHWYKVLFGFFRVCICVVHLYFMPIKLACIYFNQFSKCKQTFNIT